MRPTIVLLDRDGVLNEDLPGGVLRPEDLHLIPGSADAVARLCRAGISVAVCTNQACVGRGELTLNGLLEIHALIEAAINTAGGAIHSWHICTHRAEAGCNCRKPAPGLLLAAMAALHCPPEQAIFVGDDCRDLAAAGAAGCTPWLVLTGKGKAAHLAFPATPCYPDLRSFADHITALP